MRIPRISRFLAVLLCLLVTACGGGESDESSNGTYALDLDPGGVSFEHVPGRPAPAEQVVSVTFDGEGLVVGYPPGQAEPDWLTIDEVDPADLISPVDIAFSIDTTGPGVGNYSATVRFATGNLAATEGEFVDIIVTLDVVNRIALSDDALEFSLVKSPGSLPAAQNVGIVGDGIQWSAGASEAWVSLGDTSGTAPSSLAVDIDPAGVAVGQHIATITVEDAGSGHVETVTVTATVEPHKLFVGDNGIALADFPTADSRLSHSILVADNAASSVAWSALSSESWLTATAAGVTGDPLVATADPATLTAGEIHYAEIALSSSATSITGVETVQVGFYVADNDPVASDMAVEGLRLATDPIRPYVYVTDEGTDFQVYHIYTGALVATITAGTELHAMTVSTDGTELFVMDEDSGSIVPIDLSTRSPGAPWPGAGFAQSNATLAYLRVNGRPQVLVSSGEVFDTTTGLEVADFNDDVAARVVIGPALDGKSFYTLRPAVSGFLDITRYEGVYSDVLNTLSISPTHSFNRSFGNVRDIASNHAGDKIYTAAGGDYFFPTFLFDGNNFSEGAILAGDPYPNAVDLGPTERIYGGVDLAAIDVRSYASDDGVGPTYALTGNIVDRQLKISGDGLRMLTLTEIGSFPYSYQLNFTPVTP